MMIELQDGRRLEVQDGISPVQIDEVLQHVTSGGKPPKEQPAEEPDVGEDVAKSAATGLRQGVTGMVTAPFDLGAAAGQWLVNQAIKAAGGPKGPDMPSATGAVDKFFTDIGLQHEPKTVPGEYARTVGQFVPAAASLPAKGPMEVARNVGRFGVIPAVVSETAGQATKGSEIEGAARVVAGIGAGLPLRAGTQAAAQKVGQTVKEGIAAKPEEKALKLLKEAFDEDQLTPRQVAARLESARKSGAPVTALDVATKDVGGVRVSGANLEGLADAAANMPGKGAALAGKVAARQQQQHSRVSEYLKKALGNGEIYDITDDVVEQIGKNAAPAYEKAHAIDIPLNANLRTLLNRPAVKEAIRHAQALAKNEGVRLGSIDTTGKVTSLSTRTFDYIKRAMDDMVEGSGKNQFGKLTNEGRILKNLKNEVLDEVDSVNPDFATARRIYGDQASRKEALDMGRDFMSMDKEEIARKFTQSVGRGGFSDADKIAFAAGARRALQDTIDRMRDSGDAAGRIWNEFTRAKLKPMFPDNKSFNEFTRNMELERRMALINNRLTRGSQTASRLNFKERIGQAFDTPSMVSKAFTSPLEAGKEGVKRLMSQQLQKRLANIDSKTAEKVMEVLLSNDPKKILALESIAKKKGINQKALVSAVNSIPMPSYTDAIGALKRNAPRLAPGLPSAVTPRGEENE
jgi:hypothetical protein